MAQPRGKPGDPASSLWGAGLGFVSSDGVSAGWLFDVKSILVSWKNQKIFDPGLKPPYFPAPCELGQLRRG